MKLVGEISLKEYLEKNQIYQKNTVNNIETLSLYLCCSCDVFDKKSLFINV